MRRGKRLIVAGICAVMCFAMMFESLGAFGTLKAYAAEGQIQIDDTNFPDKNFRSYVEGFDTNKNGNLSEGEIGKVTIINVKNMGIESLQGVEFFTALTTLYCHNNNLSSLDVSKNTALTELYCDNNNLSSLDVSSNTALKFLNCEGNNLSSLDISGNTALRSLSCSKNNLSSLDVSSNTALTLLWCDNNKLSSLDVSGNTALGSFNCSENNLNSLDVSRNTDLEWLYCDSNKLNSLDVSKNTALTGLHCESNNISSLDVSKNTALTRLSCGENNLSNLDVSKNTALPYLYCGGNKLSSLDVSKNTALTVLHCHNNKLSNLDVSKNTALTVLWCHNNKLSSLDVSKNTALIWLYCGENNLSSLDVSKNTALTELKCGGNKLSSLDVSKNTSLEVFDCVDNIRTVTLSAGNKFDMSTLPGMNVSKVSNIKGGTIKGNILTVNSNVWAVTYQYDCGNGKTAEFKLAVKVSLSYAKATMPKSSYTYTGSAITPAVTVTYGGKKLKAGTDYTVAYSNNKAVGKATVTITGKGNYTGTVKKTFKILPASTSVKSLTNKTKGITIKWKKVSEAGGYYIYRSKNGGKFRRIKTITSGKKVSYTDTSVKTNGAKYQYKMIAYKKVGKTAYKSASSKTKTIYRISAPKIKELSNKSGKKIAVKWTKNKKATGYQIQYATNSKFKKAKTVTVKKASTVSKVITKLKKNSTYRVRVRAYKKVSGKSYYSAWSRKKSVKVRK